MARIELSHVTKRWGGFYAVDDLDLVIDAPGGPASGRFLRTLRPGGALYPIFPLGFAGAEEARQRGVTVSTTQVRSSGAQLARLADLLDLVQQVLVGERLSHTPNPILHLSHPVREAHNFFPARTGGRAEPIVVEVRHPPEVGRHAPVSGGEDRDETAH